MKILLTGATGFIGRHLISQLLQEGHSVWVTLTEDEKSPFTEEVRTINVHGDRLDDTIELFGKNKIEGIIHLASYVQSDSHNSDDINRLVNSNVLFGTQILECAIKANVKWFINTGTFWQNYQNADYSPVNLYAATKQAFESIAQYYIETNQIKFSTLRLCDTYGPGDTRPKIFNLWEKSAKSGEILDMSPGDQVIDISYIDDIVDAYILLMDHLSDKDNELINGSIFAVKADKRYILKDLAKIFEEVTCQKLNIKWGARPYREREVMVPWSNGKCIRGWKPKIGIVEGIRKLFLIN